MVSFESLRSPIQSFPHTFGDSSSCSFPQTSSTHISGRSSTPCMWFALTFATRFVSPIFVLSVADERRNTYFSARISRLLMEKLRWLWSLSRVSIYSYCKTVRLQFCFV